MAYLLDVTKPVCVGCNKPATQELRSATNETVNYYCAKCGPGALGKLQEEEDGGRAAVMLRRYGVPPRVLLRGDDQEVTLRRYGVLARESGLEAAPAAPGEAAEAAAGHAGEAPKTA